MLDVYSRLPTDLCFLALGLPAQPRKRGRPRELSEREIRWFDSIVSLVVRLRGSVERDRHTTDIEAIYGAEGTARLGLTLERLLAGVRALRCDLGSTPRLSTSGKSNG
jgi:hypothetical protein